MVMGEEQGLAGDRRPRCWERGTRGVDGELLALQGLTNSPELQGLSSASNNMAFSRPARSGAWYLDTVCIALRATAATSS